MELEDASSIPRKLRSNALSHVRVLIDAGIDEIQGGRNAGVVRTVDEQSQSTVL